MTTTDPRQVITGPSGTVGRLYRDRIRYAVPMPEPVNLVDAWAMPGGMFAVCVNGENAKYALILCYVDDKVRDVCRDVGIGEGLAVDVWHMQEIGVEDDAEAHKVMRYMAVAAASGTVPFEPIKPADRMLWQVAAQTITAVTTRRPMDAPTGV